MNVFLTYQQLKIPVALLAFLADRMDICRFKLFKHTIDTNRKQKNTGAFQ